MKKRPEDRALSSSHRCSSLGCILTLNVWGNCRDRGASSSDPWCLRQASSSDQSSTVYSTLVPSLNLTNNPVFSIQHIGYILEPYQQSYLKYNSTLVLSLNLTNNPFLSIQHIGSILEAYQQSCLKYTAHWTQLHYRPEYCM